ncbi:MAG TPA: hypothetical protein VMW54_00120 [Terriglobia bacterium]|nr:hypothetical protein [Terriglobia bacterium]
MFGLSHAAMLSRLNSGPVKETIRRGSGPLALGVLSLFSLCRPAKLSANPPLAAGKEIAVLSVVGFRVPFRSLGTAGRSQMVNSRPAPSAIEMALGNVHTPSLKDVAVALGITTPQMGAQSLGSSEAGMEVVGDLDGDGVPEVVVEWAPPVRPGQEQTAREPKLYMLSWDGNEWQASHLMNVVNPFGLQVLPGSRGAARLVAVVVSEGVTALPYPVIFQFWKHAAQMLWDGRSDSSFYTAYDYGAVQFKAEGGGGFPEMIASGRADPGLLVFPKDPKENGRGFEETTIYRWKDNAYAPVRTEYGQNADYTIYRFIAALHLHEFRAAYALIDPRPFLKTAKPSLKLFRESVEKEWPEFLDDRIFQIPDGSSGSAGHVFTLTLESGARYIYHPSITAGPRYLLTGLQREKKKASEE